MNTSTQHIITRQPEKELEEQLAIFEALSSAYTNVYLIYTNTRTARILKLNGYVTSGLEKNATTIYDYDAIQKQYVAERVHPEDQDMMNKAIGLGQVIEALKTKDEYSGSYRILSDAEIHYYQFKYIKIKNANYVVVGFQNIDEIVAEEKKQYQLEKEYQKELEEQLSIFDILSRGYRNVYQANLDDGTAKILKMADDYDLEDLADLRNKVFPYELILNRWINYRVHEEDQERLRKQLSVKNLKKVLAGDKTEYIGTYRSLDGGVMHNYQFYVAKMDDSGNVIAGFQFIDEIIKEHLEQERAQRVKEEAYQKSLLAAKQEAERANQAKTDFLLRMSHDIRTPLNGILGMVDIAERAGDDIAKRDDCRIKIKDSAHVLLELINEVLDMSKLESGKIILEDTPFSIKEVSKSVFTMIVKQAQDKGVQLIEENCHIDNDRLIGSPVHLKRIMTNILSNAIKYNKQDGKVFITCRQVGEHDGISYVQFMCRDTGIGMSEEFQEHLFEQFTQENETARSEYGGTGLGMSITKNLAEKMGGSISVESKKGEGSTFDVIIPFKIDTSKPEEKPIEAELEAASVDGLTILLAEDNELNMEIARFLLQEEGATIIETSNGKECLEAFEQSKPGEIDAILMDVMMPVVDGYEATRKIRALNRPDAASVPIIAMTANAFTEDRLAAKQAGMNEHLAKPLDVKLVIKTISKCTKDKAQV